MFAAAVFFTEFWLWKNRDWYSDKAAWYWESKQQLLDNSALSSDVAILGTSVTFHGIDTGKVNAEIGDSTVFSNISLNGLTLQHQHFMLERYIEHAPPPEELVLELRNANLKPTTWRQGPAWRFWMTGTELSESGVLYWDPTCLFDFYSKRLFASYSYHKSIDNWISTSLREGQLAQEYRDRNAQVRNQMSKSRGFSKGSFSTSLVSSLESKPRPFEQNLAGRYWLEQIIDTCEREEILLTIFVPPAPPSVRRDQERDGFMGSLRALLAELTEIHPNLRLRYFAPSRYAMQDFADSHHFSYRGSDRITQDFIDWWADGVRELP